LTFFLHKPIKTTAEVSRLIDSHEIENDQLDFKEDFWKKGQEAAKDAAAFANRLGGDIIIGVVEENDRATGWANLSMDEITQREPSVRQWFDRYLKPRELVPSIDTIRIEAPDPNYGALVVSIPPSTQLAAVEDGGPDASRFWFPIRTRRDTRILVYEQIMPQLANRTGYLKLANLWSGARHPVRFSSPVLVKIREDREDLVQFLGKNRWHGYLESLSSEIMVANLDSSRRVVRVPEQAVTIPLDFVRTAWLESEQNKMIHIALSVKLVWRDGFWNLES
jgi:hypothetical protein